MRRPVRYALRSIGPVLFLAFVWYADSFRILDVWTRAHAGLLTLAVALNIPIILVKAWRWRRLMESLRIRYRYAPAVRQYSIGAAIAAWTPGRLGDFVKAVAVRRERDVSLGRAASSVMADRALDALAMLVFATAGIALIPGPHAGYRVALSLAGAGAIASAGWILIRKPVPSSLPRPVRAFAGPIGAIGAEIDAAMEGLMDVIRSRPIAPAAATIPASLVTFLQGYCVARSLDLDIGFWTLSAALAASTLVSSIPITVAGIGTRETTLAVFLGSAGVTMAQIIGFSVTFLLLVQGGLALVGALAWLLSPPEERSRRLAQS